MTPTMMAIMIVQGLVMAHEPYTNFQEFYMITDEDLTSPNAVRLAPLVYQGSPVENGGSLEVIHLAWVNPLKHQQII